MKKTLAVLLALVCVLSLCACGANKELVGTYKATQIELEDGTVAGEEFLQNTSLEIKGGKNMEMTLEGETGNYQYKYDAETGKFTLIAADGEFDGTYKDNIITVKVDGVGTLTFEKEAAEEGAEDTEAAAE